MATIKKLTYEQAAEKIGIDPVKSLPFQQKNLTKKQEAYNALHRLETLIEAYNMQGKKKWIVDYGNSNQAKWRVWFIWDKAASAFRFHLTGHDYTDANSATGSRHAMRTNKIATHVGIEHLDEWNKWLVI